MKVRAFKVRAYRWHLADFANATPLADIALCGNAKDPTRALQIDAIIDPTPEALDAWAATLGDRVCTSCIKKLKARF